MIRRMISADIPFAHQIDQRSATLYWPESAYHHEVEKNDASRAWVSVDSEEKINGFLMLWFIIDEIHIANFSVDPDARCQGIGAALLAHGLRAAWNEGARVSFLEVRSQNAPAIHLYQKFGYQPVGIREKYYQDNKDDAVMMNLDEKSFENWIRQTE